MSNFNFFILFSISILLSSCFAPDAQKTTTSSSTDSSSLITSSDFAGAVSATNTVNGIKITWGASTVTPTAYRVYKVSGIQMTLLTSLSATTTGYIDGSISWGGVYSYIVRAVDKNGAEDKNVVQVSALSWAGIQSVTKSSRSSITVSFVSATSAADEIRIYVQGSTGETPIVKTVTDGGAAPVLINGLRAGFTYTVKAQAYVSSLKKEDGNNVSFSVSTGTIGYDSDIISSEPPGWANISNLRAFGASPGAPVSASNPNKTPITDLVELSFNKFSGSGVVASDKYVVTRTSVGLSIDNSTPTVCTNTTLTTCIVTCGNASTSPTEDGDVLHCRDTQVASAPARYRYTMALSHTASTADGPITWVEPLPNDAANIDAYTVLVQMPPTNMVLVQRDAVNYEMCKQMGLSTDPLIHNRCEYTGIGGSPYNSGPGKSPLNLTVGYYDFGYNLFVDRFEQACKWTRGVDGGKCGAGATTGDCIGNSAYATPNTSIGKDGDVFLSLDGNNSGAGGARCFYKTGSSTGSPSWVRTDSIMTNITNGAQVLASMHTSDPTVNGGLLAVTKGAYRQIDSLSICNNQTVADYGAKRLPRLREYRAFSTFPTIPNDLYYISYSTANGISIGNGTFDTDANSKCATNINSTTYAGIKTDIASVLSDTNNELMAFISGGIFYGGTFKLNAKAGINCQGRYGINNVHNANSWTWVSDMMGINTTTKIVTGMSSSLDSGNIDLQSDLINSSNGYPLNYGSPAATASGTSLYYYDLYDTSGNAKPSRVIVPLGLPILAGTAFTGSGYTSLGSFREHYSARFELPYASGTTTPRGVKVNRRWNTGITNQAINSAEGSGTVRCVIEAE